MRTSLSRIACVALLLVLGVSAGFGWGTLTHVYFANNLGVKFGPLNQNEIYGAVLPDLFGYDFTPGGFTADYLFHTEPSVYRGLHTMAVSRNAKAAFYGAFTHNNISEYGADWYSHGVYPLPGAAPGNGWVIRQGATLVSGTEIENYITDLLAPYELPDGTPASALFLPVVGHTLIETAVDILVRRCMDPLAGARLILAARNRSDEVPKVLAGVFGRIDGCPPASRVRKAEEAYRQQMVGYGQLFLLPEPQLVGAISQQTIGVAQMFLQDVLGIPLAAQPTFDPDKIAEFIGMAIARVKPVYHQELMTTLCQVEKNMKLYGPEPAGPLFAFWKGGAAEDELAEFPIPAENPTAYTLDQNYPNPFNPTTNIAYAVPDDGRVTLKVYNSLGQEVATLVDDNMPAGRYVATWDANGIAGGTYFYRMQAGNTVLTKRMVLLK